MDNFNVKNGMPMLRGVWHRPSAERENSLDGILHLLDEFSSAGLNTVFLEVFYHGVTFFRNDKVPYKPEFIDFDYGEYPDYLTAFIGEATKKGIQVHAWVQNFYVGVKDEAELVVKHADWLLKNQHGMTRHTTEGESFGGYIFLDPANDGVKDFLIDFYSEMLERFPRIAGLNLDYIRYPVSVFGEDSDTGYTEICMSEFTKKSGLSFEKAPSAKEFNNAIKENGLLDSWVAHRAEYVTGFVRRVSEMMRKNHPTKLLSTAVFPNLEETYYKKKQNVGVWLKDGLPDMVTPMVYPYETADVLKMVRLMKEMSGEIPCYAGLYTTYHKQRPEMLEEHIEAGFDGGSKGFVLFDSAKTFVENEFDYKPILKKYSKYK